MNIRTTALIALAGFTLLGVTACEQPGSGRTAEEAGRTLLTLNKSNADFGPYSIHVNLVILKQSPEGGEPNPVHGNVSVSAANLTGQLKNVDLKEIDDGTSIYYLGIVSVDDRETINFDFDVVPEDEIEPLLIRYSYQFYTR